MLVSVCDGFVCVFVYVCVCVMWMVCVAMCMCVYLCMDVCLCLCVFLCIACSYVCSDGWVMHHANAFQTFRQHCLVL